MMDDESAVLTSGRYGNMLNAWCGTSEISAAGMEVDLWSHDVSCLSLSKVNVLTCPSCHKLSIVHDH